MELGLTAIKRAPSEPERVENGDDFQGAQQLVQYIARSSIFERINTIQATCLLRTVYATSVQTGLVGCCSQSTHRNSLGCPMGNTQ